MAGSTLVILVSQFLAGSDVIPFYWVVAAGLVGPLVALYVGLVRYAPTTPTARALGFSLPVGRQLGIIFLTVVAAVALAPIIADLTVRLGVQAPPEVVEEAKTREGMLWVAIAGTLASPIVDEMFFRGFLQRQLGRSIGTARAYLLTAALFSVAQLDPLWILPLLLAGLVLGAGTAAGGTTWAALVGRIAHEASPYVFDWAGIKLPDPDTNMHTLDPSFLVICGGVVVAALGGIFFLRERRAV